MPQDQEKTPQDWLLALGSKGLPGSLRLGPDSFFRIATFKHDFFAATALYRCRGGRRVVLKAGRSQSLFGLPLSWIGRFLTGHETKLYRLADGIPGIPQWSGWWGRGGFAHEYVEGRPLRRDDRPDDEFFPRLAQMLAALHARDIAYVDLEKPENILVGEDGRPYLIDFQIGWHVPANRGGRTWPSRMMLSVLQESDRYHLAKHWRKLRPDQFPEEVAARFARPPVWIRWHRALFRPITLLRRRILVWLGARSSVHGRSPG